MKRGVILLMIFTAAFVTMKGQDDKSKGKFSGYMFGDYYKVVEHHNEEIKDQHGFQFRRIYFTYDYTINSSFSTRLRFEMSNEGDFTSKVAMLPFVKDAWLKYKFARTSMVVGISPTPTWGVVEPHWGYRSVEKTPLDLYRMNSSRDFGFAMKGAIDADSKFNYHFMFSNGNSNKQEIDKGKSGMFAFNYRPSKKFVVEAYADYQDHEGDTDWYTYQGFAGFSEESYRIGLQYAHQTRDKNTDESINLRTASMYAVGNVWEQVSILGRIDRNLDPNPQGEKIDFVPIDPTASSTLFLFGVDYSPVKDVSIIPNVEYVYYNENDEGVTPNSDLYAKLTFFWKFK
jgi:hypothetical protein